MKNCYVDNLRDGVRIEDLFLVTGKSIGRTTDGSPYLKLKLTDRTGTIDAIKWDAPEQVSSCLCVDDYVLARGTINRYKDRLQVVLENVRKHTEKVDPADFLPKCPKDIGQMLADLQSVITTVQNPRLRALLDKFFRDPAFIDKFSAAPAALKVHHAYIGGLLEHSLSVAQLCDLVAGHYPDLNRDLLITGSILHDVGKIDEFAWSKSIRYTDSGHLVGHIVGGAMTLDAAMREIPDFHPMLRMALTHMILSHHGTKEFGSPKRPKSLESMVLHMVEDLDAKVKTISEALAAESQGTSEMFTEKHWLLERPLMRGLSDIVLGFEDVDEDLPPDSGHTDFDPFGE